MNKVNKVLCDSNEFHLNIYPNLDTPTKIDLCQDAQINIKIPIKGLISPLKVII